MVTYYMLQRLSAFFMIPFVLVHLILMIYAIEGGLTASEILGRTRGSIFWGSFYGIFVAAASLHGALGVRTVLSEYFVISSSTLLLTTIAIGTFLSSFGFFAVYAVTVMP